MITPLPLHFKKPGRSYCQIGRKGNIALYSVYSDYLILPDYALPYILIGYELIVIKVRNGCERYAYQSEFGQSAWSIPKSWTRVRLACTGCRALVGQVLRGSTFKTIHNRSTTSAASAHLAQRFAQTTANDQKTATIAPQRRVTLR